MEVMELDPQLQTTWRDGWQAPERLGIVDFAKRYISLPASYAIPGKIDIGRSRYMEDVFKALENPRVRIVVLQCAVQTGKSLVADLFLPWVIANRPSNALWLTSKEGLALRYCETRLNPLLDSTAPVRSLLHSNRYFRKKTSIQFINGTSVIVDSATERNCQSLSCAVLVGDEVWEWESGLLRQFLHRADAFTNTSKILLLSQGADESHDFTMEWRKGSQSLWGWKCPHCHKLQELAFNVQRPDGTWAGITWDKNETTKPNGRYNLVEVAKTARLQCFHCNATTLDTPSNRRLLNDTGEYIITNPTCDPAIASFSWNKLAYIDNSFGDVVKAYVEAKQADEVTGYRAPLQDFQTKVLAKPWNVNLQTQVTRAAIAEYDPAKDWADEAYRFLMVDVQSDCFWAVCRAWSRSGESRLLWCGKLETIQQVREKQIELGVKDQRTFLDCGFDSMRVYGYCVANGHWGKLPGSGKRYWLCWNALKGTDRPDFTHTDSKGNRVKQIYSTPFQGNPALGKGPVGNTCSVYHFASDAASDILQRHFSGKGPKFLVPSDDPIYTAHMNSEVIRKVTDKQSGKVSWRWVRIGQRDNHIRDCEKMGMVAAGLAYVLGAAALLPTDVKPVPEPAPVNPEPAAIVIPETALTNETL